MATQAKGFKFKTFLDVVFDDAKEKTKGTPRPLGVYLPVAITTMDGKNRLVSYMDGELIYDAASETFGNGLRQFFSDRTYNLPNDGPFVGPSEPFDPTRLDTSAIGLARVSGTEARLTMNGGSLDMTLQAGSLVGHGGDIVVVLAFGKISVAEGPA
ncbi:hypothetical protein PQR08_29200 [Caballeronia jiangsuensis]|uniref:Bacteriophage protein n=1 Tax=Caballeronia jiangsuensis TaxID=1458357 RepID=A0ABW9CT06_9BURK